MTLTHVAELWIYPVKGLRGLRLERAAVEPWGLGGDRRWMVVDAAGRFVTQRQCPAMATLEAAPTAEGLILSAAGTGSIAVPVPAPGTPPLTVIVWDDRVVATAAGAAADAFLSAALGRPCRLVHMPDPTQARPVDPEFGAPDDRVSFADGFPMLGTTTASLDDLNRRLAHPVPMDRFRPNIVVAGTPAWAEDGWSRLRVGSVEFAAVKPCARCAVTTVDQASGVRSNDAEPIRTLQGFRRDRKGQVIFGQNLIPRGSGAIGIGDPVELLA